MLYDFIFEHTSFHMASEKFELWPCCYTKKILHSCRSRDPSVFLPNTQVGFSFEKKMPVILATTMYDFFLPLIVSGD